jgi:hypothetical protein
LQEKGTGTLEGVYNQAVTFQASEEPGLTRLKVTVRQLDVVCEALASITLKRRRRDAP